MQNPITVIDADLIPEGGPIDTVHVWYSLWDGKMDQSDFTGHDFFQRWLPTPIQEKFRTLKAYWRAIHPHERNAHIAEYLLDRTPLLLN